MDVNTVKVFSINRTAACTYEHQYIQVEKKKEDNTNVWIFKASYYGSRTALGQLGHVRCRACEVMDGILVARASACGIGAVLTELCLVDKNVNGGNTTHNSECQAVKVLENYPDQLRWAKSRTDDLFLVGRDGGVGERDSDLLTVAALLALALAKSYSTVLFILPPGSIMSKTRPSIDEDSGN